MNPGDLVIVNCQNPQEKLWGLLRRLDNVGIVLRGLNLNSVEDWIRQEKSSEGGFVIPSTLFIPMHRVEKVYLDESTAIAESLGNRFTAEVGIDVREALEETGPHAV